MSSVKPGSLANTRPRARQIPALDFPSSHLKHFRSRSSSTLGTVQVLSASTHD